MKLKAKRQILKAISDILDQEPLSIQMIKKITMQWPIGKLTAEPTCRGTIILIETGERELKVSADQFKRQSYESPMEYVERKGLNRD